MKYTVQLLDEIWDLFRKDETLAMLLRVKDPTSLAEWNTKMRRGLAGAELVDEKQEIYFVMSFIPSVGGTKNWMVNKNMLEFRLIGRSNNRKLMNDLYIHLNKLLKQHYEDMSVYAEGSFSTGTAGLIGYMFRVRPFTWS
jgi:hypothetical protein|nr:MAG TPA: hypothetical protein [Caudoviricetes sp.]